MTERNMQAQIDRNFRYYGDQTTDAQNDMASIREGCHQLATIINQLCPDSREKSVALAHLEDTMMWAVASIARPQQPK